MGSNDDNGNDKKKNNNLVLWGNEKTMNLNNLILTNIQSSHYFKVNLYELKTYHEVIDEIYYKVAHLEPWEKGSRKTAGQTGMCGGVRGVGAGGIVSTAYCLLYKLFTLKLTRKQVNGLLTHPDSVYIRALGFMYIRYTQNPADLWDWYDEYLEDPEEVDVKAGGGHVMTIGEMLRHFLTKLDWFSTLFPRIPVPIQQKLEKQLNGRFPHGIPHPHVVQKTENVTVNKDQRRDDGGSERKRSTSREKRRHSRSPPRKYSRHEQDHRASRDHRSRRSSDHRSSHRSSDDTNRHRHRGDFAIDLARERDRQQRKSKERSRSKRS